MRLHRLTARTPFLRIPVELPVRARRDRAALLHVQYVGPPVAGLPLVTVIPDVAFEDVPGLFSWKTEFRLRTSVRATAIRSRAILTVSEFTRDRIVARYGIDPARIFVTPNGVSSDWQPVSPEDDPIRQTLDLAAHGEAGHRGDGAGATGYPDAVDVGVENIDLVQSRHSTPSSAPLVTGNSDPVTSKT